MADRGLTVEQPHQSEVKLVQRLLAGDQRAFGALVERNMRRAYYVALSLVSSHDDALDLSQEAFARALIEHARCSIPSGHSTHGITRFSAACA